MKIIAAVAVVGAVVKFIVAPVNQGKPYIFTSADTLVKMTEAATLLALAGRVMEWW